VDPVTLPRVARALAGVLGGLLAVMVALPLGAVAAGGAPPPPPPSVAATSDRAVPPSIAQLPLTDQNGRTVTLSQWHGKVVVLVPFLTLCDDICPFTTGNLVQTERALRADRAAAGVQIVELSVDPDRDSPARLAAYASLTGADYELVTETPDELAAIATFFGIYYQKVPEDDPPDIDWWTGQPLTYDVNHSDGFFILGPSGKERLVSGAAPNVRGHLNPKLQGFLSDLGRQHERHPPRPNWTPPELLSSLAWMVGRPLPAPAR
jgi:protein SCO1/2